MNCPRCRAEMPEGDRFCEACGQQLIDSPVPDPAACARCGASADRADADGFCSACGVRREVRERDHMEIVLSRDFAGVSDRGLRHHRNEDFLAMLVNSQGACVAVVCDGVSSTTDADRASHAATGGAIRALARGASMEAAMAAAQTAVAALPRDESRPSGESPATTIVAAVVIKNGEATHVTAGWLGDSRAYWIGPGEVVQLTRDHSWLTEAVESGEMEESEALTSPNAHAITRWLGADAPVDSKGMIDASVVSFDFSGPGCLLLCTDGLWNYAPRPELIAELVRSSPGDAITKVRQLIDFANEQGGHDNITAVLLSL